MDMNIVHESSADDVPEQGMGEGTKREISPTLEQVIERARQLVSQYETSRVVVRDGRGGKARDLVSGAKPASRRRRRRGRRQPS